MPQNASAQASRGYTQSVDARVVLREDRTYSLRQTVQRRVDADRALASVLAVAVPFTQGMETLSLEEAYVERANGTRMPVDVATARGVRASPSGHPDAFVLSFAFPEAAVGDTLVHTTLRKVDTPAFDGHFAYAWTFLKAEPWQAAKHIIEVPRDITVNVDIADPTGALKHERTEADGGRTIHTVVYSPEAASETPDEAGATAAADRDPSFTLTTFTGHEAFAAAYWSGAADKIKPTDALKALAAEITRGMADARAKAVAVDRWLKRNIQYQAIYLGRGRWVPRAAAAVLASRAGDCKDHAVLASALLAAVGIETEHVLVNLGAAYRLPALPPSTFNHVMVHVPEAALTLDPSATLADSGVLSLQAYDKPALHVGPKGARRAQTSPMRAEDHTTKARTIVAVANNGAISGATTQTATGIFAASARTAVVRFQADGLEKAAAARLGTLGTPGTGRFSASSPSELKEPYAVTAAFALSAAADLPLAGNRRMPVGLPLHARPGQFLLGPRVPDRRQPFVCFAGTQVEELEITFASGLALPRVPPAKTINGRLFTYQATYALDGRTFKAARTFTSRVPGQVCSPALEAELAEPLKEVTASLGTMLAFPGTSAASKKRP